MTSTLDLIKRLAQELQSYQNAAFDRAEGSVVLPVSVELLNEAYAFCDGAVEVDPGEVLLVEQYYDGPHNVLMFPNDERLLSIEVDECPACESVRPGPVTVTIIVRPKGDG